MIKLVNYFSLPSSNVLGKTFTLNFGIRTVLPDGFIILAMNNIERLPKNNTILPK